MKNVNLLVAILFATMMSSAAYSQQTSTRLFKDFNVNGCLKVGSNYAELIGVQCSEKFAVYSEFSAFHKSGIGAAYYSLDDFSSEKTGRVRFLDLAYVKKWENISLYAATEYGWYDNWQEGQWLMEYAICTYSIGTWSFETAPMFMLFPSFSEDRYDFMVYAKVTKTFFKDLDLYGTVWYDTSYGGVYGTIGTKLHFPGNFFLGGNVLFKNGEVKPFASFGFRFGSKKQQKYKEVGKGFLL